MCNLKTGQSKASINMKPTPGTHLSAEVSYIFVSCYVGMLNFDKLRGVRIGI